MGHIFCYRTEESEKEILDDTKWIDDFQNQKGDDQLARTANEFVNSVTDPQLSNSEVQLPYLSGYNTGFLAL